MVRILFYLKKNTKFDQKTVSLLCLKTKSGAHKQLTFYFQMWKYFCRHLHSSLISMGQGRRSFAAILQVLEPSFCNFWFHFSSVKWKKRFLHFVFECCKTAKTSCHSHQNYTFQNQKSILINNYFYLDANDRVSLQLYSTEKTEHRSGKCGFFLHLK